MNLSVAMLSVHTSPLDSPGRTKNAGGMNVYMRQLATELGHHQTNVDIFTRWTNENTPRIVQPELIHNIEAFRRYEAREYDVLHSHYWLSGVAASHLARLWDIPHVTMFHTLARLKQLANPFEQESFLRLEMEQQLIKHADRIITATADERAQLIRYCGATTNQVQVIPCGVDLKLFVTHDEQEARKILGLPLHQPVLLFVGRLDPFKGPDLYLRAAAMMEEKAQVVIVGGKLYDDRDVLGSTSARRTANDL